MKLHAHLLEPPDRLAHLVHEDPAQIRIRHSQPRLQHVLVDGIGRIEEAAFGADGANGPEIRDRIRRGARAAGSRNPEHVRENAAAGDIELDDKTLEEIESLLPLGPEFGG